MQKGFLSNQYNFKIAFPFTNTFILLPYLRHFLFAAPSLCFDENEHILINKTSFNPESAIAKVKYIQTKRSGKKVQKPQNINFHTKSFLLFFHFFVSLLQKYFFIFCVSIKFSYTELTKKINKLQFVEEKNHFMDFKLVFDRC